MSNTSKARAESKQEVIERLWLTYFNDTLYAKGLISETERNLMRNRISNRKSHAHEHKKVAKSGGMGG